MRGLAEESGREFSAGAVPGGRDGWDEGDEAGQGEPGLFAEGEDAASGER